MRKIRRGFRCAALVGAALLGVVSARAANTELVTYWDPIARQNRERTCFVFTVGDFWGDDAHCGGWYVVKEKISGKDLPYPPQVRGAINLILCDDKVLTSNQYNPSYYFFGYPPASYVGNASIPSASRNRMFHVKRSQSECHGGELAHQHG